jgi:hypothetical protein
VSHRAEDHGAFVAAARKRLPDHPLVQTPAGRR